MTCEELVQRIANMALTEEIPEDDVPGENPDETLDWIIQEARKLKPNVQPEEPEECPHCHSEHRYIERLQGNEWECYDCGKTFTVNVQPENS